MHFDKNTLDGLVERAMRQADQAVADNDPTLYREAFLSLCQAVALLGEEAAGWREQVVRATEEYVRTEGI